MHEVRLHGTTSARGCAHSSFGHKKYVALHAAEEDVEGHSGDDVGPHTDQEDP